MVMATTSTSSKTNRPSGVVITIELTFSIGATSIPIFFIIAFICLGLIPPGNTSTPSRI